MSDTKIPVTVNIDEAASRRQLEEQVGRLAREISSKSTVTLGFRLDDGAVAAQSQRLTSAVQQSLDQTSLKISMAVDKGSQKSITEEITSLISRASKMPNAYRDIMKFNESVGRRKIAHRIRAVTRKEFSIETAC